MKRKPLPGGPGTCICSHNYKEHREYLKTLKKWVNKQIKIYGDWLKRTGISDGCAVGSDVKPKEKWYHCRKFLDRRHCKISRHDPVLDFFVTHSTTYLTYDEIVEKTKVSRPTASRRFCLFELLGLCFRDGLAPGTWKDNCFALRINMEKYFELKKEGIIV